MQYNDIPLLSRQHIEELLSSGVAENIGTALLSAALYDQEPTWIEGQCLLALGTANMDVRASAIVSISHIARRHRRLDLPRVLPMLYQMRMDPELTGMVDDTLSDIAMFVKDSASFLR